MSYASIEDYYYVQTRISYRDTEGTEKM